MKRLFKLWEKEQMKKRVLNTLLALGMITEIVAVGGFEDGYTDSKAAETDPIVLQETEADSALSNQYENLIVELMLPAKQGFREEETLAENESRN